jgi:hypothetical protein
MILRPVYIEPTDPVIELPRQARQGSRWDSKQRLDLVRGQLKSKLETGTGRVPKEIPPKPGVRQQATERAFHISLAHASSPHARIGPSVFPQSEKRLGAASHVNV